MLCVLVLGITDPQDAIRELSRVLKINGQMLIAPFRSIYHQEPYFFIVGLVNIGMSISLKKIILRL